VAIGPSKKAELTPTSTLIQIPSGMTSISVLQHLKSPKEVPLLVRRAIRDSQNDFYMREKVVNV